MRKTLTGISWRTAVASSWQVMIRLPSPARHATSRSGTATLAPIAEGRPKPIVPRPPELIQRRGGVEWEYCGAPTRGWAAAGGTIAPPPGGPAGARPHYRGLDLGASGRGDV